MNILAKRVILIAKLTSLKIPFSTEEILKASNKKLTQIINRKIRFKELDYIEILKSLLARKRIMKRVNASLMISKLIEDYIKFSSFKRRSRRFKGFLLSSIEILKRNNFKKLGADLEKKYEDVLKSTNHVKRIKKLNLKFDASFNDLKVLNEIILNGEYIDFLVKSVQFKKLKNTFKISIEEKDKMRYLRSTIGDLQDQLNYHIKETRKLIKTCKLLTRSEKDDLILNNYQAKDDLLRLKLMKLQKEYIRLKRLYNTRIDIEKIDKKSYFEIDKRNLIVDLGELNIFKIYCYKKKEDKFSHNFNYYFNYTRNNDNFTYLVSGVDKKKEELGQLSSFIIYVANKRVKAHIFDEIIEIYNERVRNDKIEDVLVDIDFSVKYVGDRKQLYNSVARFNNLIKILGAKGIYKNKIDSFNINRPTNKLIFGIRKSKKSFFKDFSILSHCTKNLEGTLRKLSLGERTFIELTNITHIFDYKGEKLGLVDFLKLLIKNKEARRDYIKKYEDFFKRTNYFEEYKDKIKEIRYYYIKMMIGNLILNKKYIKGALNQAIELMIKDYTRKLKRIRIRLYLKENRRDQIMRSKFNLRKYERSNNKIIRLMNEKYIIEENRDYWRTFKIFYDKKSISFLFNKYCTENKDFFKLYSKIYSLIQKSLEFREIRRRVNMKREFSKIVKLAFLFSRIENLNVNLKNNHKAGDVLAYFKELDQLNYDKSTISAFEIIKMIIEINERSNYCIKEDNKLVKISSGIDFLKEIYFFLQLRRFIQSEYTLVY